MNYRDLEVWKKSRALTKHVYLMTAKFPDSELYGLAAQMRRAATSIMFNIAEGQGRHGSRDQVRFYYIARGSLLELESQLFISVDLAYLNAGIIDEHLKNTGEIGRQLNNLIRSTLDRKKS